MIILTGSRCIISLSGGGGGGRGGVLCFLANAIKNFHIFFVNPSLILWANRLLIRFECKMRKKCIEKTDVDSQTRKTTSLV